MFSRRSFLVQIGFALLLAFAQQLAMLHALDHDFERINATSKHLSVDDDAFCAKCLAVGHLDHAANSSIVAPSLPCFATLQSPSVDGPEVSPAFLAVYLSRAPPQLS